MMRNHPYIITFGLFLLLVAGLMACTSDQDTPLGSEFIGDILEGEPGDVFSDTLAVLSDTTLTYGTLVTQTDSLTVGRSEGFNWTIVLQPNFEGANTATNVASAVLRLPVFGDDPINMRIRLLSLSAPYAEGDTINTLDTLSVLTDPDNGDAEVRTLNLAAPTYALPPALVQGWIQGTADNNAIAVVYVGPETGAVSADTNRARIESDELGAGKGPSIQVNFQGGTQTTFNISQDAILFRPVAPVSGKRVGDGFVQRLWFRLDTGQLDDFAAVQSAEVKFRPVPDSFVGVPISFEIYIPDSDDPADPSFLTGRSVTLFTVGEDDEFAEFSLTNTLLGVLAGELNDNGFVMKYQFEASSFRRAAFYGSDAPADSLRPRVFVTSSEPADF